MKTQIFILIAMFIAVHVSAQRFDLGNKLNPAQNEFEYLGTSSKTGVSTYRYKKQATEKFFNRAIGDIIVGVRDGIVVTTIYNMIPNRNDVGVPSDMIKLIEANLPFPFTVKDGIYGLNIDNETISIARVRNELTFNHDRIMLINSVKQSILESTK
jgi:hypothetical protein